MWITRCLVVLHLATLLLACTSAPITKKLHDERLARPPQTFSSSPAPVTLSSAAPPSPVALILPADGPAARAAEAVRHGFLAAWYALNPQERPTVSFHPFHQGAVKAAYRSAVEAGATLIIGPLAKEELQTLIRGGDLSHRTLALNYLAEEASAPARLYQFGLAPADEARQSAQQAWIDGHTRAVIITPNGDWGERVRQVFRTQWANIGGTVVSAISAESNPDEILATLLSTANPNDFIFLATPPELAQHLSPLLRQSELPIYATSHVLAGTNQDSILADLQVVDLPWLVSPDIMAEYLRSELKQLWPNDFVTYRRIYALGVDALRLISQLATLEADTHARIQGVTGSLALDSKRRIVRQGAWTLIKNGQVKNPTTSSSHSR